MGDAVPASSVGLALTGGLVYGANVGCLERYVVGSSVGAGVPTIRFFDGFGMGYADGPYVRVAGGLAVIGNSVDMSIRGSVKDLLGSTAGFDRRFQGWQGRSNHHIAWGRRSG